MLAQAATHAGYTLFVIDTFADLDTQQLAVRLVKVPSLTRGDLIPAVSSLLETYPIKHCVYGSGFEYYPESLAYLATQFSILGNTPQVFASVQNKQYFFSMLSQLHIPFPRISFWRPSIGAWLVKPLQGQGGLGVSHYRLGSHVHEGYYWQEFKQGLSGSVLFLADGERAKIIGFNRQWCINVLGQAFVFSGIVNYFVLDGAVKSQITGWVQQLTQAFGLRGLNALDFIKAEDRCYVLEINARPSASMQLYTMDLLSLHIQACQGVLVHSIPELAYYQGYQIIYADQPVRVPDTMVWPDWCMDLPVSGALIDTGLPICSIMATHCNPQHLLQALTARQQVIVNQFFERV